MINRTNADLVNNLGNLVNRTISMDKKYFEGIVENPKVSEDLDNDLIKSCEELYTIVPAKVDELKVGEALQAIFDVLKKANKYIDDTTPWILAKDETKQDRLKTVLYNLLESIRICTIYLQAFIPDTAAKIFKQLNTAKTNFEDAKTFGLFETGITLNEPEHLFDRIEIKEEN